MENMKIGDVICLENGYRVRLSDVGYIADSARWQPPVSFDIFDPAGHTFEKRVFYDQTFNGSEKGFPAVYNNSVYIHVLFSASSLGSQSVVNAEIGPAKKT